MMKKLALAAVFAATASTAFAGGMAEPVMEMAPAVIVEETTAGSINAGLIIPLVLIALIAVAVNNN